MTKSENFPKAYKEIIEILKYLPKESIDKIPNEIIQTFELSMDKEYEFHINQNKDFENQNLLDETKAILANIFRDYWATPYQKQTIIEKEICDRQKDENEKRKKYNPDELFNKNQNIQELNVAVENNLPIELEKEKFYIKIIKYIKKLLKII